MYFSLKRVGSLMAACGLLLTVAACSPSQPGNEAGQGSDNPVENDAGDRANDTQPGVSQPGENGGDGAPAGQFDLGDLPAEKDGTIKIEGMDESIKLKLFDHPKYVTYHPEEMVAEPADSGEGDAVSFIANFGGQRNENAFVHFFLYPEGTSEEDALFAASGLAEQLGSGVEEVAKEDRYYDWSLSQYAGIVDDISITISVGKHGDQLYQLLTHYPVEYGDGMGPRVNLILDELIWKDDGKGLGG